MHQLSKDSKYSSPPLTEDINDLYRIWEETHQKWVENLMNSWISLCFLWIIQTFGCWVLNNNSALIYLQYSRIFISRPSFYISNVFLFSIRADFFIWWNFVSYHEYCYRLSFILVSVRISVFNLLLMIFLRSIFIVRRKARILMAKLSTWNFIIILWIIIAE